VEAGRERNSSVKAEGEPDFKPVPPARRKRKRGENPGRGDQTNSSILKKVLGNSPEKKKLEGNKNRAFSSKLSMRTRR